MIMSFSSAFLITECLGIYNGSPSDSIMDLDSSDALLSHGGGGTFCLGNATSQQRRNLEDE